MFCYFSRLLILLKSDTSEVEESPVTFNLLQESVFLCTYQYSTILHFTVRLHLLTKL